MSGPCTCWFSAVALHEGHCCMAYYDPAAHRMTCGHDEAGMALFAASGNASGVWVGAAEQETR